MLRIETWPSASILVCPLFGACSALSEKDADAQLTELAAWMTGSFDTREQSLGDPDYAEVQLHIAPLWTDRKDGRWFYAQQALASAADKPYRQRVYQVHAESGGLACDVYTLPGDALRFAGAWNRPELLAGVTPESLSQRTGCTVHFKCTAESAFAGSTENYACASELHGAKYATSTVTITESMILSWDQGFDASGKQVWGATKGPYRFVRQP